MTEVVPPEPDEFPGVPGDRKPLPWKWIGIAALLAVAVIGAILLGQGGPSPEAPQAATVATPAETVPVPVAKPAVPVQPVPVPDAVVSDAAPSPVSAVAAPDASLTAGPRDAVKAPVHPKPARKAATAAPKPDKVKRKFDLMDD
jgi:hypothetical protein